MAGHTTLGIRRSDGREYWMGIHARGLDYLLHDPDFQREGPALDKLLDRASKDGGDWHVSMLKRARYYNYGYVAVDFMEKTIYSRQGYCALDTILAAGPEGMTFVESLQARGDLKELRKEGFVTYIDKVVSLEKARDYIEKHPYSYVRAIPQGPLTVDHSCIISDQEGARDVRAWAKSRGWGLKTSST